MTKLLMQYKKELDFMKKWNEQLLKLSKDIPYEDGDIRSDYFKTIYTNTHHFYLSYINIVISKLLQAGSVQKVTSDFTNFRGHLERIINLSNHPRHLQAHFNTLNQRAFIISWSLFELAIATFYEAVVEETELKKQKEEDFNELLKHVTINNGKEDKVKKLIIKQSLHQIPIIRKYNYLLKKAKGYGRNLTADRAFLEFFGKLRNTMHSNFIYYGKYFEYSFGDAHFVFKNKEIVRWTDPFDTKQVPSVELYFHLIGNLNMIVLEIFKCNPHEKLIPYPDQTAD